MKTNVTKTSNLFRGCRELARLTQSGKIFRNERSRQYIHQIITFLVFALNFFSLITKLLCSDDFSNTYIFSLFCVSCVSCVACPKFLLVSSFASIFSQSISCLFVLFMVSFAMQKLIGLIRSQTTRTLFTIICQQYQVPYRLQYTSTICSATLVTPKQDP